MRLRPSLLPLPLLPPPLVILVAVAVMLVLLRPCVRCLLAATSHTLSSVIFPESIKITCADCLCKHGGSFPLALVPSLKRSLPLLRIRHLLLVPELGELPIRP
ncbi:hypothetical protein DFJ73DRAFT_813042 [Zopfochytrium polystomum]|nr:hypothetical protein DFJ73DRAFT_813042 [Zopfochytrium polystomum]